MKSAIVTGASRGLGLALTAELLGQGAHVVAIARTRTPELVEWQNKAGDRLTLLKADLIDTEGLSDLVAEALQTLPGNEGDQIALINNAGLVTPIATAGYYPHERVEDTVTVNITAPMLLTDAFLRFTDDSLAERRIVNISSGAAVKTYSGWGVYGASKAALDHFSRIVAAEQAETANPVRIAALYPGVIDTDMQATIRQSDEQQFSNKARFLELKEHGLLTPSAQAARHIIHYLFSAEFGSNPVVDIRELDLALSKQR